MRIQIGLLFSLTGTTSLTEKGQCDAARFAIEEYNRASCQVEAVIADIGSDPRKGAQAAEKLARQGVRIFVGCYTSTCRQAILPVLEAYHCLLVYPTLYEGKECHPNVIYTGELPNQQIHTLLDYMTSHYGKRVYCIGTDYYYPRETHRQVHSFLAQRNGMVVKEHYVPFGHQHFHDVLSDIAEEQPDAVFSTLVGKSIAPFYRDFHRMAAPRKKIPIFSPITKETELAAIGTPYRAGHYSSASYFQSLPGEDNKAFIATFQRFLGEKRPISSVMYNTYLGTKLILESLLDTKSISHRDIVKQIKGRTFPTVCGPMALDTSDRHLSRPVKIGKSLPNGQFEIVWDSKRSISPAPFLTDTKLPGALPETVLNGWSRISDEALIVATTDGLIVYMSEQASALTQLSPGQTVAKNNWADLSSRYEVTCSEQAPYLFYLLKAKASATPTVQLASPAASFGRVRTSHPGYQAELNVARLAAESQANVLILGETGTGKEVLAEAIHRESERRHGPFLAINAASLPRDLIASELFGFVDGAFTGAKKGGAIGKFEAANNGTIFLDEIGDMPLDLQAVLLRVIESRKIVRLGDTKERAINVRIIAATNRNLLQAVANGDTFRADLFYRLNVLSITIPPLRERSEDIRQLAQQFLHDLCALYGNGPHLIEKAAWNALLGYQWPGNVRELRNVVERAFLLAKRAGEPIRPEHLPSHIREDVPLPSASPFSLKKLEQKVIEEALQKSPNVEAAAQMLGIARSTLYRKIKEGTKKLPENPAAWER